ncbi:MAG: TerC/Alx family metal homeostasis membrane protein [Lentimicrobiaceae bacterium]|nr:TerC/Alx family metal homeostasis membrane protein [Lentimicrobiaceae bacterium]
MHISAETSFFVLFLVFILGILFFDLKVIGRHSHVIGFREALTWTIVWVSLAILFYLFLLFYGDIIHGLRNITDPEILKAHVDKYKHPIRITDDLSIAQALVKYRSNIALEYITGYLIEYSLSVDNVFVMLMIFLSFGINKKYYKKVLFWGILGAIVMRFIFIFVSAALIAKFAWILYIFGVFLVITGIIMFLNRNKEEKIDPHHHPVVRFTSRYFLVYPRQVGERFFIRKGGLFYLTPLMLVLLVIEFTDVVFAVDSVPAIFAVTKDPYIVFFSNIFAILGLRSLFFLLMNFMTRFRYLKHGLAFLLVFIGLKMLLHHPLEKIGFETIHSLVIIVLILGTSVALSVLISKDNGKKSPETGASTSEQS